jgi:hypothetical protein
MLFDLKKTGLDVFFGIRWRCESEVGVCYDISNVFGFMLKLLLFLQTGMFLSYRAQGTFVCLFGVSVPPSSHACFS